MEKCMARSFTRPELSANDIDEFQAAKCIMINPDLTDVALALQIAEKGCRKNKLPLDEAQAAWRTVCEGDALTAGAGEWSAPKRARFDTAGTVLQIVRFSDDLVGLSCDRQDVFPGQTSSYPVPDLPKRARLPRVFSWLQSALQIFWTHLSDEEIDSLESQFAYRVMASAKRRKAREVAQRKKVLDALYQGPPPEFVTEFNNTCLQIGEELQQTPETSVSWQTLKKTHPSATSRYQTDFLLMLDEGKISIEKLTATTSDTPYRVHFSVWEGPMRIFDEPQLVFEIRNPTIHSRFASMGGAYEDTSYRLKDVAGRDCHPGTATTIGWLRVHVDDDNHLCFVDEVQSDTLEAAYQMEGAAAAEFYKECQDWHIHGFATISRWAAQIGYRAAIHSKDSAMKKDGMTQSDRKWNTYYRAITKRFNLIEEGVAGYPEKIWVQGLGS
jgi:hypothetical protein